MKTIHLSSLFILIAITTTGFALSTEEMRTILDKKQATVADALTVLGAVAVPGLDGHPEAAGRNPRLKSLDLKENLTFGTLSIITIELGLARGSLWYQVTGFSKYAAESLVFIKAAPDRYSFNRLLSGEELIGFAAKLGENAPDRR